MTPEDIGDIFQALEDALFAMAIRTMKHHENWEQEEGFQWTQWQAEQIQGLRAYRQNVTALTDYYFTLAKQGIEAYLRQAYRNSVDDAAETARTIMMQTGRLAQFSQQFFGVNSKKLDVLINEAIQNIDTKRYAAINRMNTGYTDMLRKADIFAQSGSFTIPQAVDMAAKDFLSAGLNCVEYSNGNRVNIASYAEMALRTSSSEVTRQANGDVRDELGEYLVVSNVIGITCPICQKWQGKVLIDDVYASGKPDGKHKLVSQAKADGFMHPNCRHQLYMYIPGLTEIADLPDTKITHERYKAEQQQRYQERQIRKYKRLRDGAMDPGNRQKYDARVKEWTQSHNEFLEEHDYLRKNPKRLGTANYDSSDASLIVGNIKSDREQYARYKVALGDANFEMTQSEFVNTKYFNGSRYESIQQDYHDIKELKKYEDVLGVNRVPSSLEDFKSLKYNDHKAYSMLQREYLVISDIGQKNWSDLFKERAKECYYTFRSRGYEINAHGVARFLDRSRKERTFSYESIFQQLVYPVNYYQEDGRGVRFYNGIAIVTEPETDEIVTIIWRKTPKADWRFINGTD